MRGPTIPGSRTPSYSCRTVKTKTRMGQASGWRENSLQLFRVLTRGEKQRYRCRERPRDKEKRRWQESTRCILLGIFYFSFKMRRPGVRDEQPHQQRGGY